MLVVLPSPSLEVLTLWCFEGGAHGGRRECLCVGDLGVSGRDVESSDIASAADANGVESAVVICAGRRMVGDSAGASDRGGDAIGVRSVYDRRNDVRTASDG